MKTPVASEISNQTAAKKEGYAGYEYICFWIWNFLDLIELIFYFFRAFQAREQKADSITIYWSCR